MAYADRCASPTVAGIKVIRAELAGLGVVVQIPLDAQVVDGLEAQPRDDRRQIARRGEIRDPALVQRGVEDVAPVVDQRPAEVTVDKILLRNLPTGPLAHLRWAAFFCISAVRPGAGFLFAGAQVKALSQRESRFVGVGGDVGAVDQQHIPRLFADAGHIAVEDLRFDDVAQFAIPAGEREIPFESRRSKVHRGFEIRSVERIVADRGNAAVRAFQVGSLADGVGGLAQRGLGQHTPAAAGQR